MATITGFLVFEGAPACQGVVQLTISSSLVDIGETRRWGQGVA